MDVESLASLEPTADACRNCFNVEKGCRSPTEMMVDRADPLNLAVPEMTVLIGGMPAIGANTDGIRLGVFTDRPGSLSNEFFVNLLDMPTTWRPSFQEGVYEGRNRAGTVRWAATPVDLTFGSHSELRAVARVDACNDGKEQLVNDLAAAWVKVMQLDCFDPG